MNCDRHGARALGKRRIDQIGKLPRVAAPLPEDAAQLRIAEIGKIRVVELKVRAACRGKLAQLLAVDLGDVGMELGEVRIGLAADRIAAAAQQHRRRGNGLFCDSPGVRFQKQKILDLDRASMPQLAGHLEGARPELTRGGRQAAARVRAFELLDEITVEGRTPVFAVGNRVQAYRLLHRDGFLDVPVLQGPEFVSPELTGKHLLVRGPKLRRAQQAADVVGAKRRAAQVHRAKQRPVPVSAGVRYAGV